MANFFRWVAHVVDGHWGDLNGQWLIILGVVIVLRAHTPEAGQLGNALVLAGMAYLRGKSNGKFNEIPKS